MASFSDRVLIEEASLAAKEIVESDPDLEDHLLLKRRISDYLENAHLNNTDTKAGELIEKISILYRWHSNTGDSLRKRC